MIIMFFASSQLAVVLGSLVTPVSDVHALHTVASLLRRVLPHTTLQFC